MRRVLITGVNGFCARHLIRRLTAGGDHEVYGTDIHAAPATPLGLKHYTPIDLSSEAQVEELVKRLRPDDIFHLAGRQRGTPRELYRVNFLGALHLLDAVKRFAPHARVLMVGSAAEYGHVPRASMPVAESFPCRPLNAYGISKFAATSMARDYALNHGIQAVTARPFNIVGPGVSEELLLGAVLARVRRAAARGKGPLPIAVGHLDTERDFIAVDDVVDAYIAMLGASSWGEVFNICSGVPRTVRSVLEMLARHSDRPIHWKVDPELVRPADVPCMFGSFEKAKAAFGFEPRSPLGAAIEAAWHAAMGTRN
jgi:GDP-4-dehydro-6-deoxy-D-mannose reductase